MSSKSGLPGDIERGMVRSINTVMGDFLADAEALFATRFERVSRQARPNPLHP